MTLSIASLIILDFQIFWSPIFVGFLLTTFEEAFVQTSFFVR
jgi:hypothetical protein